MPDSPVLQASDHDLLIELRRDVAYIKKAIDGNGRKGIVDRIETLERFQWKAIGVIGFLCFLGGGATAIAAWVR